MTSTRTAVDHRTPTTQSAQSMPARRGQAPPAPTLRHAAAAAGNRAVASLVTSTGPSRGTGHPDEVQRRVPSSAFAATVAGKPDDSPEVRRFRKVLRRTWDDYVAAQGSGITAGYADAIRTRIATGSVDRLIELVRDLEALDDRSQFVHPGHVAEERQPTPPEYTALGTAVTEAKSVLLAIASGLDKSGGENLVRNVFGSGWGASSMLERGWWAVTSALGATETKEATEEQRCRAVFANAATALGRLYTNRQIVADALGESTQTSAGGLTNPNRMLLGFGKFEKIAAAPTSWDHVSVLVHESFHAIPPGNIADSGGYRGEAAFSTQVYARKLLSAPHYEEVAWQYKGSPHVVLTEAAPSGGGGGAVALTPHLQGLGEATDLLRLAWTAMVGGLLSDLRIAGRAGTAPPAARWLSGVIGLTLHKRLLTDAAAVVSELDVALAESVTRRLSKAYAALRSTTVAAVQGDPVLATATDAAVIRDAVATKALTSVGPIRHSMARDMEMARYLAGVRGGGDLRPDPASDPVPRLAK